MARNRIQASVEDTTIAAVAEVAAKEGVTFDEALEQVILAGLPVPEAPKKTAAKKTATKSRK